MRRLIIILCLLFMTACSKADNVKGCDLIECADPIETGEIMTFKGKYEFINGTQNEDGVTNRTITIPEDHPFVKVSPSDVKNMISESETFYLYVGDELCPWCRSVIEKCIEVSKKHNIDRIYYIEIWDDDGKEIFRDKYIYDNNELKKVSEADPTYQFFLEYFNDLLKDYTLDDINVGEKRIYAPSFFYVSEGKPVKMTTGISDKQSDSRQELSKEILKDEETLFEEFFLN